MADQRKLVRTKHPGIYRRHTSECAGNRGCDCPYIVRWKHRGRGHKRMFRTLAEAREFKGKADAGQRTPPSRQRIADYYERWIDNYRGRTRRGLEEASRNEIRNSFERHVLSLLGRVPLRELSARDIREWMGELERRGASPNVIRKAKAALSVMLATAVEDDDIPANVATGVRYVPSRAAQERHPKRERHKLTGEDVGKILAAMPERWRTFFRLLTQTGVRIGELLALTWGCVDLGDDPCIRIEEQIYDGKRKRLKTDASTGRVPLASAMARELQTLRSEDADARAPVFPSRTGTPLEYHNVYRRILQPALRQSGLAVKVERDGKTMWDYRGIGFHAFRRFAGSALIASGKNPRQVQGWLRHAQLTTTMNAYIHEIDDGLGDADVWDGIADWSHPGATVGPQTPPNGSRAEVAETSG
jgi:integrase